MAERTPRTPPYVCFVVEIRRLVAAGFFKHNQGVHRGRFPMADPRDFSRDHHEPIEVAIAPEGGAVVSIGGQAIHARSRPMPGDRGFWQFECPGCSRSARKLFKPIASDAFRCGACWRIARPSRSSAIAKALRGPS